MSVFFYLSLTKKASKISELLDSITTVTFLSLVYLLDY